MIKRLLYLFLLIIPLIIASPFQVKAAPSSVTVTGNLQSEIGCASDWNPACATTHLNYDPDDNVWQKSFLVPAGNWEYKAALNDSWTTNYGINATPDGANIPLSIPGASSVKFYYDDQTHWITDNQNSIIAVATGSFQTELGASGDWQPDNLRSWLKDPDGNGIYTFSAFLPAGNYEAKVAINESWILNYGSGGVQGGANIPFAVPSDNLLMNFSYTDTTHLLSINVAAIDWVNLQWPLSFDVNTGENTPNIYGQAWINGATNQPGLTPGLTAQVGYGNSGDPTGWTNWFDAAFNVDSGNNDEFVSHFIAGSPGEYSYGYRFSYGGGAWQYSSLGEMEVLGSASVPEPATMLLLGLGLIGLAGIRKKLRK